MARTNGRKIAWMPRLGAGLLAGALFVGAAVAQDSPWLRPAAIPAPADNQLTADRIELGKKLFFDPRLSGSNWISCATCHNPALGWSDGLPTAIGHDMKVLERNTPTILNTAYNRFQFWDGRARTLEEQALGPIVSEEEMNQDLDELVRELKAIPGYVELFEKAYPGEGITKETIAKAIASFERSIVSTESPFDRWQKGQENAVSDAVKRGFELFQGKARCVVCHQGFNFTDDGFHNIGLKGAKDPGRYKLVKVRVLKHAFKTPTLRDVELTWPYMHDGRYKTLEEVVEHYNRGGDTKTVDPNIQPLGLSKQEVADLVAFMKSLTGDRRPIEVPQLP